MPEFSELLLGSLVQLPFIPPPELSQYEALFRSKLPLQNGLISVDNARSVFLQSGLANEILGQIWRISDFLTTDGSGISFPEFCLAMFLIKAKLGGRDVPSVLPEKVKSCVTQSFYAIQQALLAGQNHQGIPSLSSGQIQLSGGMSQRNSQVIPPVGLGMALPTIHPPVVPSAQGYPTPSPPPSRVLTLNSSVMDRPKSGVSSPALAGSPSLQSSSGPTPEPPASGWVISLQEKAQYDTIFKAWDMGNTGFITPDRARQVFAQSGLSPSILNQIWKLADMHGHGKLNMDEFAVAMYLIYAKLGGRDLPLTLPQELIPPSKKELDQLASFVKQEVLTNLSAPKRNIMRDLSTASFGESSNPSLQNLPLAPDSAEEKRDLLKKIESKRQQLSEKKSDTLDHSRLLKSSEEEVARTHRKVVSLHRDIIQEIHVQESLKASPNTSVKTGRQPSSLALYTSKIPNLRSQIFEALKDVRQLETRVADRKMEAVKGKHPQSQPPVNNLSSLLSGGSSDPVAALLASRMAALGMGGNTAEAKPDSVSQSEIAKIQEEKSRRLKVLEDSENRIQSILNELSILSTSGDQGTQKDTSTAPDSLWKPNFDDQLKFEDGIGLSSQDAQKAIKEMKELSRNAKNDSKVHPKATDHTITTDAHVPVMPMRQAKEEKRDSSLFHQPVTVEQRKLIPSSFTPKFDDKQENFSRGAPPQPISINLRSPTSVIPSKEPTPQVAESPAKIIQSTPVSDKTFDILQRAQQAIKAAEVNALRRSSSLIENKDQIGVSNPGVVAGQIDLSGAESGPVVASASVQQNTSFSGSLMASGVQAATPAPTITVTERFSNVQMSDSNDQASGYVKNVAKSFKPFGVPQSVSAERDENSLTAAYHKATHVQADDGVGHTAKQSSTPFAFSPVENSSFLSNRTHSIPSVPPTPPVPSVVIATPPSVPPVPSVPPIGIVIPTPPVPPLPPVDIAIPTPPVPSAPFVVPNPPAVPACVPPPPPPPPSSSGVFNSNTQPPLVSANSIGSIPPPPPPPPIGVVGLQRSETLPKTSPKKMESKVSQPPQNDLAKELSSALKSFRSRVAESSNNELDKDDEWSPQSNSSLNKVSLVPAISSLPTPPAGGPPPPPPPPTMTKSGSFVTPSGAKVQTVSSEVRAPQKKKSPQELGATGPNLFKSAPIELPSGNAKVSGKIKGLQGNIAQVFGKVSESKSTVGTPSAKFSESKSPIQAAPLHPVDSAFPPSALMHAEETRGSSDNATISHNVTEVPRPTDINPFSNPFATRMESSANKTASPVKSSPLRTSEPHVINPFDFNASEPEQLQTGAVLFDDVFGDTAAFGNESVEDSRVEPNEASQVEAQFPLSSQNPDELSFNVGDLIRVEREEGEWLYGSMDSGQKGWFPKNYTRPYISASDGPIKQVRVQFDFGAENQDELSVTSGDIVAVIRKVNADWWLVKNSTGKSGLVPCNFLTENLNPILKRTENVADAGLLDDPFGDSSPMTSYGSSPSSNLFDSVMDAATMKESPSLDNSSSLPKMTSALDAPHRTDSIDDIAMAEMPVPANMNEEERKRFEAIREMLSTEKKYCDDVRVIVELFLRPMVSKKFISKSDGRTIFSNIETIYEANTAFLTSLERSRTIHGHLNANIGVTFMKHASSFECYKDFCGNLMAGSKFLLKKREQDDKVNAYLRKRQNDPKCRNMDLASFLLKPMQRVTRYSLLLRQILHFTPKNHPEHPDIFSAFRASEELAKIVNQATKESESIQKIQEISQLVDLQLPGEDTKLDLAAPTRYFGPRLYIHDGPLAKNKSGRKLHGYVFNDLLLLAEPKAKQGLTVGKVYQYELYEKPLSVTELIIRDVSKTGSGGKDIGPIDAMTFQIVHSEKVITLRASSVSEKRQWMNVLESTIQQAEKQLAARHSQDLGTGQQSDRRMIGTLEFKVLEARKLVGSEKIRVKPGVFCVVKLDNQTLRSKTCQSWPPKWSQDMMFSVYSLDECLTISLFNYDRYSKDEFLGEASIQLDFLEYYNGKETEKITLNLGDGDGKSGSVVIQMAYRTM